MLEGVVTKRKAQFSDSYGLILLIATCMNRDKARREDAGKDARMLGIRSWWSTAINREEWRRLLREARTLTEL
jgi:hypothetical protein